MLNTKMTNEIHNTICNKTDTLRVLVHRCYYTGLHSILRNNTTRKQCKQKVEETSLGNGSLGSGSMQFVVNNNSPGEQVRARTMGTRNVLK